ncbi:leucine-rich repeat-containing protein 43 [Thamnophis elegans]|uniref:leucine-rich repeat-containing protein 43 n=1 Tax=Thamnophis elegans TaxID=35005 RepID=UPI0013774D56|nr:leucine-rich repeat-containing protein 43 [Thamnophis elegans]
MERLSASAAFWDHLRTLCLKQFPCGVGSWNKSRFPPPRRPQFYGLRAPRPVTLLRRDGLQSPNEETVEALTDFLRCPDSPWALPPDCSPPEQQLRELAVLHPQIVRSSFVCCYFRSLRIVNKGVTEIDVGLLKFPNLEELILTANHISTIPAANLPPGLKVLELCGNEVQSLKELCTSPPAKLQHLGLSHNCQLGSSEEQYLAAVFWPNLVSLDLSYNNFTNLQSLLSTLSTLKTLRILILQGNPFALLPCYRGFAIDSLPHISVFDDVIITPEERHNFLNLSNFPGETSSPQASIPPACPKRSIVMFREKFRFFSPPVPPAFPEALLTDVQLIVTLGKMRGVPNPFNSEDIENSPDSPIVTYSYYVTYEFAKGEKKEGKAASKVRSLSNLSVTCVFLIQHRDTLVGRDAYISRTAIAIAILPKALRNPVGTMGDGMESWSPLFVKWRVSPPPFLAHLVNTHSTAKKGWAETIDCDYRKEHLTEDLVALKTFLLAGSTVSVIEEKVVSWPVIHTPEEKSGKKGKGKGEKGKADSGKAEKGGGKKKKKPTSPELRRDPPIVKILGSVHVNLEKLLAGASLLETLCDFGVQITERNVTPPSPKDKESKKGGKKDPKAKSGMESTSFKRTPPPPTPSPIKGKLESSASRVIAAGSVF